MINEKAVRVFLNEVVDLCVKFTLIAPLNLIDVPLSVTQIVDIMNIDDLLKELVLLEHQQTSHEAGARENNNGIILDENVPTVADCVSLPMSDTASSVWNSRLQQATITRHLFQQPGASLSVQKSFCSQTYQSSDNTNCQQFDERLLEVLVCPLSKQPLRYDKVNNELVSDSIGVAYPIKNGIPDLVPQDARTFEKPLKIDK